MNYVIKCKDCDDILGFSYSNSTVQCPYCARAEAMIREEFCLDNKRSIIDQTWLSSSKLNGKFLFMNVWNNLEYLKSLTSPGK